MLSSKRRVIFLRHSSNKSSNAKSKNAGPKLRETSSFHHSSMSQTHQQGFSVPDPSSTLPFNISRWFTHPPPLRDRLKTESSALQDEVVASCLPLINAALDPSQNPFDYNQHGLPSLSRRQHVDFLRDSLEGEYPAKFIGIDASRPWILYWALNGLALLGEDIGEYEDA